MKISRIEIENCKSYRTKEAVVFDGKYNILVGPNGGGKSNTLDIITIALRRFFLKEYTTHNREENAAYFHDIEEAAAFQEVRRFLEPNLERKGDPVRIAISLVIGDSDVDNIGLLRDNIPKFKEALASFRRSPFSDLGILEELSQFSFLAGSAFNFIITDGNVQPEDELAAMLQRYLQSINFFLLLAPRAGVAGLKPPFTYFSPYRAAGAQDLRANLSGDSFRSQLAGYSNASSHAPTSLLKLATLYFGEFRRSLETRAKSIGYASDWDNDPVVKNVSRYLTKLGYKWDVKVIDENRNIYEISLNRDGRDFSIEQASSGEKEILTFVLGVFALRTSGGLILIDEPEVHLHPRWQATLRDLLTELAEDTGNQLLVSTHSPVFINPSTIPHVRRVYRDSSGSTRVTGQRSAVEKDEQADHWHMLNSHNNEKVFFADIVVLVEGIQDRIIFDALVKLISEKSEFRGVVEIIEIHGKNNFSIYQKLLSSLGVSQASIADRDYAIDLAPQLANLFAVDFKAISKKVLRDKKSKDRENLGVMMERAIETADLKNLRDLWEYIRGRHRELRKDLSSKEADSLKDFIASMRAERVYILTDGEIEDYLPVDSRSLKATIELAQRERLVAWLQEARSLSTVKEILDICLAILGIDAANAAEVLSAALTEGASNHASPTTTKAKGAVGS